MNDDILARAFSRYPSFLKAKVVRDKRTGKTKGFGFVSFKDPNDYVRAMREMNGELMRIIMNVCLDQNKNTFHYISIYILFKSDFFVIIIFG